MMRTRFLIGMVFVVVLALLSPGVNSSNHHSGSKQKTETRRLDRSPYVGQETREIKSLSPQDIEWLRKGSGMVFGGMAKLAELNSYPGPRHVLDLADEMSLSEEQRATVEMIYMEMRKDAIRLGEQIITGEKDLSERFAQKTISDEELKEKLWKSALIYGELRYVHLRAHLQTANVLVPQQIVLYNSLRGYASEADPSTKIPEGHDPELWKLHHNCERRACP